MVLLFLKVSLSFFSHEQIPYSKVDSSGDDDLSLRMLCISVHHNRNKDLLVLVGVSHSLRTYRVGHHC